MAEVVAVRHDLAHVPLAPPSDHSGLLEVFRRRYLLRLLVRREIKARYIGSKFGLLWSYINPAVRFATFYFIFGILMGRGQMENFAIHLFAGMVFVHFFTETYQSGMRSIISNRGLVQKMAMPKEMFPVASMLVSLYHTGPQLVILIGACLLTGWNPDLLGFGAALMGFAIVLALGTALALLFSALNVLYRDFGRAVQTFSQVVPFSVPMMYPYEMVTEKFGTGLVHTIYMANPLAEAVLLIQRGFWVSTTSPERGYYETAFPDDLFLRGWVMLAACVLFLGFAQWAFSRLERRLPELL